MGIGALLGEEPGDGSGLINARAETVHTKRSYGAALRSRRCLAPANGWFEWQRTGHGKQPYFLVLADGSAVSFAALWERWDQGADSLESFTIITRVASPALADIHHRQSAIIGPDRFDDWVDPSSPVPQLLDLVREPFDGPEQMVGRLTMENALLKKALARLEEQQLPSAASSKTR